MKNGLRLILFLFSEPDFWEFWGQRQWLIKMADICYNSCSTLCSSFELPSFHNVCYTIVKYHVSAFTGFTVSFKRFLLSMQSRKNSFDSLSRTLLVNNILNILIRTYGIRYSKIWSDMVCWGRPYYFKFFKGGLPQILLGPFLNTLPHMSPRPSRNLKIILHISSDTAVLHENSWCGEKS